MKENLVPFIISKGAELSQALHKIDRNKQGFLIVIDDEEHVAGVLTDGDVRRALLAGHLLSDKVMNICTQNAKAVKVTDTFDIVSELFKSQAIKFLPILGDDGKLENIITKAQFHTMLLQDIPADLCFDFLTLDTSVIDSEIFMRPWGFYKTTVLNKYYQSKVISVKPEEELSLQSHEHREEYWIVVHGNGRVQLEDDIKEISCGSYIYIPKGAKHRLINTDEKQSLIITEVQIGEYLGEDDIIRYEDKYGRI